MMKFHGSGRGKHARCLAGLMVACLFWVASPEFGRAQIVVGGLAELELRYAGALSNPGINNTPKNGAVVYTPNIRLFFDGAVDESWSVLAVLQSDFYGNTEMNRPFFSLLAVQWQPFADRSLFLSGGRLIIPVGSYSERFLAPEYGFRHLPVSHEWTLPVDKVLGYTEGERSYETFPGMTILYNRLYTSGVGIEWFGGENDAWNLRAVWGTSAPSGFYDYGPFGMTSLSGRLTWRPVIALRLGVSGGFGPYMKPDVANDMLSKSALSGYGQRIIGADVEFSYRYLVLRAEWIGNRWSAPEIGLAGPGSDPSRVNSTGVWYYTGSDRDKLDSQFLSAELIYRIRMLPGLRFVARYDQITFDDHLEGYGSGVLPGNYTGGAWYGNIRSVEAGLNYAAGRNVLVKLTLMQPWFDGERFDAQTVGLQVSAMF